MEMPGEDPLLLDELTGAAQRVVRADRVPRGEHLGVVELGDEALVEVAQAVDQLAVARLRGHDLNVGLALAQEPPGAHERARGAEPGDEVRDLGAVAQDLRAGGAVVRVGVGRVAVLVEHHPVGVLRGEPLGHRDGLVRAARRGRGDDLGAVHREQLSPLLRRVLRHHADQPVALELARHGQRDAGVAGRGLEHRAARAEQAVGLGPLDHRQRGPVLDRPGGVAVFQLRPQPDIGRGRQRRQPDERGVADRRQQGVVAGHQPPATAGRMVKVEFSPTFACRPPEKRMSSSST